MAEISRPHSATIKRHLDECLLAGVPLPQIHGELVEIFQRKGKYSIQQITAKTSWLLSQALQRARVNPVDTDENDGESPEDVDFCNIPKNQSRDWHFSNIQKHSTSSERKDLRLLLMPGRNTHDLEAARNIGLSTSNLLTFIDGRDPKSNAAYIRNCRDFGVTHRHIGDMAKILPTIDERVQGAYFDFWGQFCSGYTDVTYALPVAANEEKILVGVNTMKGREHKETKTSMHAVIHEQRAIRDLLAMLLVEDPDDSELLDCELSMGQIREQIVPGALIGGVGIARSENWLCLEQVQCFVDAVEPELEFRNLSGTKKLSVFFRLWREFESHLRLIQAQIRRQGSGVDLIGLMGGSTHAIVNTPFVRHFESPHSYVSTHKNRPFISYFAELATRQSAYQRYTDAVAFVLTLATDLLPKMREIQTRDDGSLAGLIGYFGCEGNGARKEFVYRSADRSLVASINHRYLLRATTDLCRLATTHRLLQGTSPFGRISTEESIEGEPQHTSKPVRNIEQRVGRNDPCPCGSGHKFKKCCMRHKGNEQMN